MTKLNKASEQALNELLNDVNIKMIIFFFFYCYSYLNRMLILMNTVNGQKKPLLVLKLINKLMVKKNMVMLN
jgi:hypothetical protein